MYTSDVTNKGDNNNHNNNSVILNIIMLPVLEKIRTEIGKVWYFSKMLPYFYDWIFKYKFFSEKMDTFRELIKVSTMDIDFRDHTR